MSFKFYRMQQLGTSHHSRVTLPVYLSTYELFYWIGGLVVRIIVIALYGGMDWTDSVYLTTTARAKCKHHFGLSLWFSFITRNHFSGSFGCKLSWYCGPLAKPYWLTIIWRKLYRLLTLYPDISVSVANYSLSSWMKLKHSKERTVLKRTVIISLVQNRGKQTN